MKIAWLEHETANVAGALMQVWYFESMQKVENIALGVLDLCSASLEHSRLRFASLKHDAVSALAGPSQCANISLLRVQLEGLPCDLSWYRPNFLSSHFEWRNLWTTHIAKDQAKGTQYNYIICSPLPFLQAHEDIHQHHDHYCHYHNKHPYNPRPNTHQKCQHSKSQHWTPHHMYPVAPSIDCNILTPSDTQEWAKTLWVNGN